MTRGVVLARPKLFVPLVLANLAAGFYFVPKLMRGHYLDLEVYQIGARTLLNGGDVYGVLPATSFGIRLPFTYPPVAAALFTPLTLLPVAVAGALLTGFGLAALVRLLAVPGKLALAVVLPVAVLLEPVRETLNYGQINLLLMALVAVDCLTPSPRWPRGLLIGLAAAIKLTPAGFLLFFLLRKDFRAAATAAATFLAATAAGFLLAGTDSLRFWTGTLLDTGRIGTLHYAGNQSLVAVLARFGIDPPIRTALWLLGAGLGLALAAITIRHAVPELALAANALTILVVSPVSWSHHWVWAAPVLLALWRTRARILAASGLVVFVAAPQWWWPGTENREYAWNLGQQLLGNLYLYFAILVLAVLARRHAQGDADQVGFAADGEGEARVGRGAGEGELGGEAPGDELAVAGGAGRGGEAAEHGRAEAAVLPAVLDQQGDLGLGGGGGADELGEADDGGAAERQQGRAAGWAEQAVQQPAGEHADAGVVAGEEGRRGAAGVQVGDRGGVLGGGVA
jgi:alpha-1,2-mannosyltransferase